MSKSGQDGAGRGDLDRRSLLRSAVAGVVASGAAAGLEAQAQPASAPVAKPPSPDAAAAAGQAETAPLAKIDPAYFVERPGSDFMVDVLKTLDLEYVTANPGSSFRGLHESLINYGGNTAPELLTCPHEEVAVSIAHGYTLAAGKPMMAMLHETVGMQHGAMAVYNAFADRIPMLIVTAANRDAARRAPPEWGHGVQDPAGIVRDITKWDDQPGSVQHAAESLVRGYQLATSAPTGPVVIAIDIDLQEQAVPPHEKLAIPALSPRAPDVASAAAIEEVAAMLVAARNPVILADRYARSKAGVDALVTLAESLNLPVLDGGARLNIPTTHYLCQSARARPLLAAADLIVALEPGNLATTLSTFEDQVDRHATRFTRPDARIVAIGHDSMLRSNYQEFGRYLAVTLNVSGDAQASVPALTEAVRRLTTPAARAAADARGQKMREAYAATREREMAAARFAWDSSPITTGRLTLELWDAIKGEDWAFVSGAYSMSNWIKRLLPLTEPHHYGVASGGAGGLGGGLPRAIGGALAYRAQGRLPVAIISDGDLFYTTNSLWTAAHHRIPLLVVTHNNRAYHQETMHLVRMAAERQRDVSRSHIGTVLNDPPVDFATIARGMGVYGEGPISAGKDLAGAFRRAIAVVKRGEPALVDVCTQPR